MPAIRAVVAAAFATAENPEPVEPGLVDDLRESDAWLPALSMVGERDGEVVAHALLSRVTVEPGGVPALVLGPVAVRPAEQGTGLGTAVVRAALDAARDGGETAGGAPRRAVLLPALRLRAQHDARQCLVGERVLAVAGPRRVGRRPRRRRALPDAVARLIAAGPAGSGRSAGP